MATAAGRKAKRDKRSSSKIEKTPLYDDELEDQDEAQDVESHSAKLSPDNSADGKLSRYRVKARDGGVLLALVASPFLLGVVLFGGQGSQSPASTMWPPPDVSDRASLLPPFPAASHVDGSTVATPPPPSRVKQSLEAPTGSHSTPSVSRPIPSPPPSPSPPPPPSPPPSPSPPPPSRQTPPPPPHECSDECVRNTMPRLPVLTAFNTNDYPKWHAYVADVYHQTLTGDETLDLNTFTFFYKGKAATDELLSGAVDPCLRVCVLRSWPDRPEVFDGTVWVGDNGPEEAIGEFGFFVVRPFITTEAVSACESLEVMHVRTDWLGGEHGVSWFFHAVGSGVKIGCHELPSRGEIAVYRDRQEWRENHDMEEWAFDGDKHILEKMERDGQSMVVFTAAGFTVFNQEGNNPSTEIIVRHASRESSEQTSQRESCLDDDTIGLRLKTGLEASVACECRPSLNRVNCDSTPVVRAAVPPFPPSSPPPRFSWKLHADLNCWWDGHGSEEVDDPPGTPVAGVSSLAQCKASCEDFAAAHPDEACDGVLWNDDGKCFRKRDIDPGMCAFDQNFDLYMLSK